MSSQNQFRRSLIAMTVCLLLTACADNGAESPDDSAPARVRINAYPGGSASWLTQIASARGVFRANGIQVEVVPIATGPQVVNAFTSGSLDVAILDPTVVLPLISKGQQLKLTFVDSATFFTLMGGKGTARPQWPQSVQALEGNDIGVLAVGSANHNLLRLVIRAAGLTDDDVRYVSTGSVPGNVAALLGSKVEAAMVEVLGYCQLSARGYPVLFSYLLPEENTSSPPAQLRPLIGLAENTYWTRSDWAARNPELMRRFQLSMLQAGTWVADQANLSEAATILRQSPYNVPTLSDSDWKACVKAGVSGYGFAFSSADATTWEQTLRSLGVASNTSAPETWIDGNVPSAPDEVAKVISRLQSELQQP